MLAWYRRRLRQKRDGLPLSRRSWVGCVVKRRPGAGVAVPEIHQRHRFVGVPAALGREAWTQRCKGENGIATARGSAYVLHRILSSSCPASCGAFFCVTSCYRKTLSCLRPVACLALRLSRSSGST